MDRARTLLREVRHRAERVLVHVRVMLVLLRKARNVNVHAQLHEGGEVFRAEIALTNLRRAAAQSENLQNVPCGDEGRLDGGHAGDDEFAVLEDGGAALGLGKCEDGAVEPRGVEGDGPHFGLEVFEGDGAFSVVGGYDGKESEFKGWGFAGRFAALFGRGNRGKNRRLGGWVRRGGGSYWRLSHTCKKENE